MRRKSTERNGQSELEEAFGRLTRAQASLVETQAALVHNHAALLARLDEVNRENAQRFARLESDMAKVLRILAQHGRILEALPEAIRERIGFKPQQS